MPLAANVLVGTTGAVYIAPLGTVAPATSIAAWIAGWKELGYLSEDGIVEEPAMDVEEIKVWQSGAIVRRVLTGSGLQWTFTCVETRLDVMTNFYPGSVHTAVVGPPGGIQVRDQVAGDRAGRFGVRRQRRCFDPTHRCSPGRARRPG